MIKGFKLKNRYSIIGLIKMSFWLIRTKILFKNARLIRFPIDIRGKKYIKIEKGFTTGIGCRLEAYPEDGIKTTLFVGENVQINDYVHITAMKKVQIGNNVLLASKIYISDCSHGFYGNSPIHSHPDIPPMQREYNINGIEIMDNVWIGESVSVLPGVTIGKGAIIGANSVVSKSIPEYTIAVGSPARVIKKFNFRNSKWEKFNQG